SRASRPRSSRRSVPEIAAGAATGRAEAAGATAAGVTGATAAGVTAASAAAGPAPPGTRATGGNGRRLAAEGHRLTELDSGVRVVTEAMPSVRSIALGFWIGVGSR